MSEEPWIDVDAAAVADRRAEVLARVADHAGRIAHELAVLQGGDYGQETFETDAGRWTLKYEAGDAEYLRFEPRSGSETYVVSTKQPPEPDALADALADYDSFVEAFGRYVASFEGVLDDVRADFPEVASTASVVAERERILTRVRRVANTMAGELHRSDGEYGTFSTTVSGTRWELKWDGDRASYLRVGGSDGVYLLSQYGPPSVREVRRLAPDVGDFVEAFNEHVADLEADLSSVSLSDQ